MQVHIPTPLRSYTNAPRVQATGATLDDVLRELDRQFPGMRFRIVNEQDELREHIRVFINQRIAQDLNEPLQPDDDVRIIMAISGG
jgi:molybdopterin converting factor small subunit